MSKSKEQDLAAWVAADDSELSAEFETEILGDDELAEEAYEALELTASLREVAAQPVRLRVLPRLAWATGLVAAVLSVFLVMPNGEVPTGELLVRLRGMGDSGAAVALTPAGETEQFPRQFVWSRGQAAADSRFRWELYDSQARRRAVAVVTDTFVVGPLAEIPADSVGVWRWLVVELKADGMEGATSGAQVFTVNAKERQ